MNRTTLLLILLLISTSFNIFLVYRYAPGILESAKTRTGQKHLELLKSAWEFSGRKEFSEKSVAIDPQVVLNNDTLDVTYDLHGLCLLPGDSSGIYFQDIHGKKYQISLSKYGKNCYSGMQTTSIPLDTFGDLSAKQILDLHMSVWYPTTYAVDIESLALSQKVLGTSTRRKLARSSPTLTPAISTTITPTATTSPTITAPSPTTAPVVLTASTSTWPIQSVSSMKETKDKVCSQDSPAFIAQWVDTAKKLGVNYISVETPYDNPTCDSAVAYTKLWLDTIRSRGISVWHRHAPLSFEGIYNTTKDPSKDYISQITTYIKDNASFFKSGDIFSPIPEPQNGGITGVTYCSNSICIFSSAAQFNKWLRDAMTASEQAFTAIGLGGKIKVGYYGFDGFVAWGDNNPDWHGILEDATVKQMGNITIDHYPEAVGETMKAGLDQLQAKYPTVPIVIGEWGTITGGDTLTQVYNSMGAAKRPGVVGFNYWHMGMGGYESLINDDFTQKPTYAAVQSFYQATR